jgi:hypothetical protein
MESGNKMVKTLHIKKFELMNALENLPEIEEMSLSSIQNGDYDVFICALGFEKRCLRIPKSIADLKTNIFDKSLCFEYSTNQEDNNLNKKMLTSYFEAFSSFWENMKCDENQFIDNLRSYLKKTLEDSKKIKGETYKPYFIYDISVCSTKVIYTEAEIYHPTIEDFESSNESWVKLEGEGHSSGIRNIVPVFAGFREGKLDSIIAFPTFKAERTHAIIAYIDESVLLKEDRNRLIWIIGDPNMEREESNLRKQIMRQINTITEESKCYEVSTLNYKKTIEILDQIYLQEYLNTDLNISALGSKMQSLGIAIYSYIRPEISVYTAISEHYNSKLYSEGCKKMWQTDFRDIGTLREYLNKIGTLEIMEIASAERNQ